MSSTAKDAKSFAKSPKKLSLHREQLPWHFFAKRLAIFVVQSGGLLLLGHVCAAVLLTAALCPSVQGQSTGSIKGSIRATSGAPVVGAVVIATNQVSGKWKRTRSGLDGMYSMRLNAGAYRLRVAAPHVARFDKDKNYGEFAIARGDALENVIVEAGKETVIDIPVDQLEVKAIPEQRADKPLGHAGRETVPSEPQTELDRREAPDRWRVGFPEYDRYGDRAARGRDIPFKRGRWWDPYHQSVLKGDYPIKGNNLFMILSAVSTTGVEQRRAPTPSGVSSVDPRSAEFFGQPEQFAASETLQLSFELFHGDTTFKPRDWAIKISPTFSIPNYLNARENGIVNIDVRRGTNRTDTHVSFEEAFGEVKLWDVNANYDFVSVRAGIQPFVSDFRGFIFSDNNLGIRFFGAADNNRIQYNAAYFSMLEKDTNSGLNRFDTRHQNVYVDNIFRQDFIRKGYKIQGSLHYNEDRRSVKYDRNGIRLTQTGVGLVQPNSVLPSLRSSKTQGQGNFVNPGIFIYNAGIDVEVTQRIKTVFNVNYLRFHRTEPLEYVLFQNHIRHDIGFDYSLGVAYRPFLINNVTVTFGASTLQTGRGFRDIFTDRSRNCPPNVGDFCEPDVISPSKPLYSLFAQLKLVF